MPKDFVHIVRFIPASQHQGKWISLLAILFCMAGGCNESSAPPASGNAGGDVPKIRAAIESVDLGEEEASEPVADRPQTDAGHNAPGTSGEGSGVSAPQGSEPADDVHLTLMDWDAAQQLVASHLGKVVVLDLWATTCLPCRREFPALVQLHREHPGQVACVSYSTDYSGRASKPPESYRDQVLTYLVEQGATFDNILGTDDPDELHRRLELAAIPAVYVYDRQGRLRRRFDNTDPERDEFTYEADVIPLVQELLEAH